MKMFWLEILQKSLNYALPKIQAQQTLKFDAAVYLSLYRLLKWTQQFC